MAHVDDRRRRPALRGDGRDRPGGLIGTADELVALLPGSTVRIADRGGPLGRLLRTARHGDPTTTILEVEGADGGGSWRVHVATAGLAVEALAQALQAAFAVRRRFDAHLPPRIHVWFDRGRAGGSHAGEAHSNNSAIWLAADFVLAERPRAHRLGIGGVVVHELGHLLDLGFQARRYRESIDFRRRLGEHLGVPTIEQARKGTPAHARMAAEVSDYSTTNHLEAFAELFTAWWQGKQAPVVACFGELVEEYFPQS